LAKIQKVAAEGAWTSEAEGEEKQKNGIILGNEGELTSGAASSGACATTKSCHLGTPALCDKKPRKGQPSLNNAGRTGTTLRTKKRDNWGVNLQITHTERSFALEGVSKNRRRQCKDATQKRTPTGKSASGNRQSARWEKANAGEKGASRSKK